MKMILLWVLIVVNGESLVRRDILFVFFGIWFLFFLGGYLQDWSQMSFVEILIFLSVFLCHNSVFDFGFYA